MPEIFHRPSTIPVTSRTSLVCLLLLLPFTSLLQLIEDYARKRLRSHKEQFLRQSGSGPKSVYQLTGCCRQLKTSYIQVKSNFAHWPYIDDTLALKAQSVPRSCMSGGKAFQSRTVLGGNDILLFSVLQRMVWNLLLVFLIGEINLLSLLMATSLLSTLYSMQRRASLRLSSRVRQSKPWSMSLTLDLLRCLLVTYRAARRCTISSLRIFLSV